MTPARPAATFALPRAAGVAALTAVLLGVGSVAAAQAPDTAARRDSVGADTASRRPAPAALLVTPAPATLFGEVRARAERDQPGGDVGADAFTWLRTRVGIRADVGPHARIVVQMQDSRVLGAESNASSTAPDVLDLHQGYVELTGPIGGRRRGLRGAAVAGRQEIAFANERLVGAANWTNTGRAFDGLRLTLAPSGAATGAERWSATAFGATVEERGRHFGAVAAGTTSAPAPDHAVVGLFTTRAVGRGALETTLLYDRGARYRAYDAADRVTLDGRARSPRVLGVAAEVEGAWQAGRQRVAATTTTAERAQDVRAWLLGARLGTPTAPARRAAVSLGIDLLSGDADATDGRYGAFSTMFATNHPFYGLMDLFLDPAARTSDRGLVDALATATAALTASTSVRAELHHFATAVGTDRPLGWEGDLVLPVRVGASASVEAGYSAFRAARGAAHAGLGADGATRQWAYLQLRAGF